MQHLFLILGLVLFLNGSLAQAQITENATLQQIMDAIEQSETETLVVFDVDDVLIKANDQLLQLEYQQELNKIIAGLLEKYSPSKIEELSSLAMLQYQTSLVDPQIKEVFHLMNKRKTAFIALTATDTGQFGQIKSMEDWRIQQLNDAGFDFSHSFPNVAPITFTSLLSKRNPSRHPTYKGGILFSCDVAKGEVLKAFLASLKIRFKHIIFIDDIRKNLDSVAHFCQEASLSYQGFEYNASQPSLPFNKQRAMRQIHILIEQGKWMSDAELGVIP